MTTHRRGEVVWYPALFEEYHRPYLLITSDRHPFHGEEYIGLAITTAEVTDAIQIDEDAWVLGELPEPSAVKPWNPTILKHDTIRSVAGVVQPSLIEAAVSMLTEICTAERSD